MTDINELRARRQELQAELDRLVGTRERAFRANSDALSLQRTSGAQRDAAEMSAFAASEVAGDSGISDLRRQIELIDDEIADEHGGGVAKKAARMLGRLRR